jgi:hypothetical protein
MQFPHFPSFENEKIASNFAVESDTHMFIREHPLSVMRKIGNTRSL